VDGVAEVVAMRDEGDSTRVTFRAPQDLARFIAPKGSVALNGTSLTVNEVDGADFGINFIPHTKVATTWGDTKVARVRVAWQALGELRQADDWDLY
jgi:riboflavin synthase